MREILKSTKKCILLMSMMLWYQSGYACATGGNIKADTSRCDINRAKLFLINHVTTAGTTYAWQASNDGGLSWATMASNSGRDTQLVPLVFNRLYRCISTCPSGTAMSDVFSFNLQNRQITVDQIHCSATAGGNDSITLKIAPQTVNVDTTIARNFKWQISTTNGILWTDIGGSTQTLKVAFNPAVVQYRAYATFCPLKGLPNSFPGTPSLAPAVSIGLNNIGLTISNKDCINDTARLSLTNVIPSLAGFFKYRWADSTQTSGAFNFMGLTDSSIKVKVDSINRFYRTSVKLCTSPHPSKDSVYTSTYAMWVKLGALVPTYDCQSEVVELDYAHRDLTRKSVHVYWTRSLNDSINHTSFTDPVDSLKYNFVLNNGTNNFYKIYSKFCDISTKILDSSYNVNVKLKIDTGQLKGSFQSCTNDSAYLRLQNYKDSSNFTLVKKWMIKRDGSSFWEDYTQAPQWDTVISFRMINGLNSYRKSVSLCSDKYAKKWSSSVASTFLPYQPVYNVTCSGNMTINVLNDTIKILDYTGTVTRSNTTAAYQWLRSTNKITGNIVAGATSASLTITQADRGAFYKRLTRICASNTYSDTTNWSNYSVGNPSHANGRAVVLDQICLNDTVRLCVANLLPNGTDTASYVWQYSEDDINWVNMNTVRSNDSCMIAIVTPKFQYFRRLTYWCPSGRVDSTISTPLIYVNKLPWFESFTAQAQFGENILWNCWRGYKPVCQLYGNYAGGKIWSESSGGKSGKHMSNWGPTPSPDAPKMPPGRRNDLKLVTPAFELFRGKVYRFSFWHQEDASNICWDSLYVTWGTKPGACDVTNRFGTTLTRFSFDQWNKFWADFSPPDDGIYYFGINIRDNDQTTGEIKIDELGLKEVESCKGKTPVNGMTFAPSKIIDRVEEPSKAQNYDKSRVTHQYCLWDTIMLTYQESNYASNFDYHGMTYQFYKRRSDADWKIEDTFFRPVLADNNCHITNRTDYHVMNVMVTDTHTWYKIVATCQYDGKVYHADSLLVNGTHSVPYCEDWESVGPIQNQQSPMPAQNSGEIVGRVPSFAYCPTCWAGFPQFTPAMPAPNPQNLHSFTLPIRNPPGGNPLSPQLSPDGGFAGNTVVMNAANNPTTNRKVLVMPAYRFYKGRGYRISFRWTDNRTPAQGLWGNVNQDLDSLYLVASKGNRSGERIDSFQRFKMIPNSLQRDIQGNILENGPAKYRTYWVDYTPNDTGTYFLGIVVVPGAVNGGSYRFIMDYFCVDTLEIAKPDCSDEPKFDNPLQVKVSPDAKTWLPGDTEINPSGVQWCVGNRVNLELSFGLSNASNWKAGYKHLWQCTNNDYRVAPANGNPKHPSINWITVDSSNGINYVLSNKFRDCRLVLTNQCRTKGDTVGPFKVWPFRGEESCIVGTRETFRNDQFGGQPILPQCWDVYPPCRVSILQNGMNEFGQMAKLDKNFLNMDFIQPNSAACPTANVQTFVPPGYGVTGGITYRFSFWYKDNGISVPIDSIVAGYSLLRPTDVNQFRLVNLVNNDVVKNSRTNQWRYYTTEVTRSADTSIHFKIKTFNLGGKRIYYSLFDDLLFKPKQNIDALVIAIDSPDYQCGLSANSSVKVTVMNIGNNTLTDVPVKVQVNGGGTIYSATVSGNLVSNESKTILVPNLDLSAGGINEVKAWTEVLGEQFACDDTLSVNIVHNIMPEKPTDTIDSVCICKSHTMTAPYNNARWYRNATDFTPISEGGEFTMDSVCKDTSIYYSQWNGGVCFTDPYNFSGGTPTYSTAPGGITFDNISRDTILIDSVMVYVNSITAAPTFVLTLRQFYGGQQVTRATVPVPNFTKLGRQWIPVKIKVPPGTDYALLYSGGAALAQLPNYIFLTAGCPTFSFNFRGDEQYPTTTTAYKYFFNWKLVKCGCETERVKKTIKVISSPKFQLADTARVCSQPVYQFCGPNPPVGETYRYQWASSDPADTLKCKGAKTSGWYKLSVTNEFGCIEEDSTEVIVDPSPEFNLGADTSFCRFTPYTIATKLDSLENVVTWNNSMAGVSINVLNPGTYIATAYNTQNFCTAKDTINLIRYDLPVLSLGNDRVFCGSPVNIEVLAPNLPTNLTYTWSPPAPNITSSGHYWVDGYDPVTKCTARDSIFANLQPKPILDLGADVLACGSTHTIVGPSGNYFYKWNTTATTKDLTVAAAGTYYLTVTDKTYGCESVDSVKVGFKVVPVFNLGTDIVKCDNQHSILGPAAPAGDTYSYAWTIPDGSSLTGNPLSATSSGLYILTVSNNCYTYTDSIRLTLKAKPEFELEKLKDTAGCRAVNLKATDSVNYISVLWQGPAAFGTSNSNTVQANTTGTYSVSLTNECGTATKAIYVRVDDLPVADFLVNYPDTLTDSCMSISLDNRSKNAVTYLWTFGDGSTSAQERPLHTYTQEGTFLVTLKAYNSCGFSSKTLPIKKRDRKCTTLGISGIDLSSSGVYIYPNPASDHAQLLGVGVPNGKYKLAIRNLLGQVVYENNVNVLGNEVDVKLDVVRYASGEYLVELSNDRESIVRKLQIVK